jgi:indolepyruvate ferredoxin oxidoreductase
VEPTRLRAFAQGLREILVIEEKAPVVETQLRDLLYDAPAGARPAVLGKRGADGAPLISALGELRPSRLIETVAAWLVRHFPHHFADRLPRVRDFTAPPVLSNAADAVRRLPYFCAGCPHNTSTRVPEGSSARAGIGCHFMANWMDRDTAGLIQMGGEGVDWVSHALFTRVPHVFQNLGDGTYYHSGYLAIRQAVATGASITYKILYNDAVAMTGGQPVDGVTSVDAIARQVDSEGVKQVVVVSDDITSYDGQRSRFPGRHDLPRPRGTRRGAAPAARSARRDGADLRADLRRRKAPTPQEGPAGRARGAGVHPRSGLRRLRRLHRAEQLRGGAAARPTVGGPVRPQAPHRPDQPATRTPPASKGFCPSFVRVRARGCAATAGQVSELGGARASWRQVGRAAAAAGATWTGPYDLLVTGVGGTGVVTVGALVSDGRAPRGQERQRARLHGLRAEGRRGAVLRAPGRPPELLNQVRIDTQQADALLACDLVVGASARRAADGAAWPHA